MIIVLLMVIPLSKISTVSAITSVSNSNGASNNIRKSNVPVGIPRIINPSGQRDPFATQSQNLKEVKFSSNTIVYTDPVKSGNEPSIAAHPTNPKIVLAAHKSLIDLLDETTNRTCDISTQPTDGGKTWSKPISVLLPPVDDSCTDPVIRWAPGDGADKDKNVRVYANLCRIQARIYNAGCSGDTL